MCNIFKTKRKLVANIKSKEAEIKSLKEKLNTTGYQYTMVIHNLREIIKTLATTQFDNKITARKIKIYCTKHKDVNEQELLEILNEKL